MLIYRSSRLQDCRVFAAVLSQEDGPRLAQKERLNMVYFNHRRLKRFWQAIGWHTLPKAVPTSLLRMKIKHRAVVAVYHLYPEWPEQVLWEAIMGCRPTVTKAGTHESKHCEQAARVVFGFAPL
jgi:hypothetical protein